MEVTTTPRKLGNSGYMIQNLGPDTVYADASRRSLGPRAAGVARALQRQRAGLGIVPASAFLLAGEDESLLMRRHNGARKRVAPHH